VGSGRGQGKGPTVCAGTGMQVLSGKVVEEGKGREAVVWWWEEVEGVWKEVGSPSPWPRRVPWGHG